MTLCAAFKTLKCLSEHPDRPDIKALAQSMDLFNGLLD